MTTTDSKVAGLIKLLESDPRPMMPQGATPEQQKYYRSLDSYLRRLLGRFSGANIWNTLIQENSTVINQYIENNSSGGFAMVEKLYHYKGTDSLTLAMSSGDWLGRVIFGVVWILNTDGSLVTGVSGGWIVATSTTTLVVAQDIGVFNAGINITSPTTYPELYMINVETEAVERLVQARLYYIDFGSTDAFVDVGNGH